MKKLFVTNKVINYTCVFFPELIQPNIYLNRISLEKIYILFIVLTFKELSGDGH